MSIDRVICCNCDKDCTTHHWMCDVQTENVWCPECFEKTACHAGVHGEGCPTQVFNAPPSDPLRNNPVVGFMSEKQAEGILEEMRAERLHSSEQREVK
jgi:hypothetical protein